MDSSRDVALHSKRGGLFNVRLLRDLRIAHPLVATRLDGSTHRLRRLRPARAIMFNFSHSSLPISDLFNILIAQHIIS